MENNNNFLAAKIASPEEALCFASLEVNQKKHIVYVTKTSDKGVECYDLNTLLKKPLENAFELFHEDYDNVLQSLRKLHDTAPMTVEWARLGYAFQPREHHLCAGMNYLDHAKEVSQANATKAPLVLFPKYGKITSSAERMRNSESSYPELLDFEIELGVTFHCDIKDSTDFSKALAGFFICNDFTDRAPQILLFGDVANHNSYSFAAAKSKKGYSLVSPLLVIPKNWKTFYKNLKMQLSRNSKICQKSSSSNMSLSIEEMIQLALQSDTHLRWPLLRDGNLEIEREISLVPIYEGKYFFPQGSIFMTGTPGGTLFQKPNKLALLKALISIPRLGKIANKLSFKKKFKLALIQNLFNSGKFLKSGDTIESNIEKLGSLNFKIK